MKLNVHVRSREASVQVFCPDLPGCSAAAASEPEALRLLRERIAEYFLDSLDSPTPLVPGTRVLELEV